LFLLNMIDIVLFPLVAMLLMPGICYYWQKSLLSKRSEKCRVLRFISGGMLDSIFRKYGNLDNYFLHIIPNCTELVISSIIESKNNYFFKLRKDFYLVETLVLKRFPLLSALYCLLRHLRIIAEYDITLIHSNYPYIHGVFGVFLAKVTKRPFCVSIHTDYEKTEKLSSHVIPRFLGSLWFSRQMEMFVYRHADMILPISDYLKNVIVAKGAKNGPIEIFYHGIDLSPFMKSSEVDLFTYFNLPLHAKIISTVSQVDKDHYSYDVIDIAIACVSKHKDIYFVICGNGRDYDAINKRLETSPQKKNIRLPGMIPNKIALELRKASFVNLCFFDGFGLIEACASGRPVIGYDVEWNYELIKNDETGYLVRENDKESVLERISYLLQNPGECIRLGEGAKKTAFENFSLEATNKRKAEIYFKILQLHQASLPIHHST
jgi:glycosyltransferase involved in cell wall biosynthesis